jgi:AsmA protein
MGKVLKWLSVAVVGVVILIGIGAGILMALLDEDTLKAELTKIAHQTTGGELLIDGALGLSLFPQLGVSVEQLRFTPRDEQHALASIDTLKLGVDFMPLFSGQINVGEITLNGLRLNLERSADGVGNWENLSASDASPATTKAPKQDEPKGGKAGAMTLAISQLHIADTEINYTDLQSGENYRLSEFSLDSEGVNLAGSSFPAGIRFKVNTSAPQLELVFELDTQISGDMQAQILELQSTSATINVKGEPTSNIPVSIQLATDARVDLQKDTATLQNLKIQLEQLKLSGAVDVSHLSGEPRVVANLQSERFNPRQLAKTLQQTLPEFTHDEAFTQLRFASDIEYSGNSARLNNLNIALDKTQINGSVAITDLQRQALVVKFKVDQINLDDYQVVVPESATEPSAKPKAGTQVVVTPLPLLPVDTVKALNLKATLTVGKLIASGAELTDIAMKASAKKGLVKLSRLTAKLYQGSTDLVASVDVRPSQPQWKFNGAIAKIQLGPLLKATSDVDWVEGTFDFDGQLSARGNLQQALMQSLVGPAKFSLSNGVLREMNLEKTVCQAIALINSKRLSSPFGPDTILENMNGSLQFGDGRLDNTAFTAGLSNATVKGSGSIGLVDNSVDYRMGIRVSGKLEEIDPACEVNKRYKDIYWPLRCKGSLDDEPSKLCGIDEDRMNEVIQKMAEEEIKSRASGAINDALERLLGR